MSEEKKELINEELNDEKKELTQEELEQVTGGDGGMDIGIKPGIGILGGAVATPGGGASQLLN